MLWLAAYLMGLPPTGLYTLSWTHGLPPMFFPVNQDILYKEFGVDAELLIDHAWGLEPCGMKEIKAYKPSSNSISEGQVLSCPYPYDRAKIIVMEMADSLVLQLTDKGLVTDLLFTDSISLLSRHLSAPQSYFPCFLLHKTSVEFSYTDPSLFRTVITVLNKIFISNPKFQLLIYSVSSRTTSSKSVISLRPLTCHIPVIPGLMAILAL